MIHFPSVNSKTTHSTETSLDLVEVIFFPIHSYLLTINQFSDLDQTFLKQSSRCLVAVLKFLVTVLNFLVEFFHFLSSVMLSPMKVCQPTLRVASLLHYGFKYRAIFIDSRLFQLKLLALVQVNL